MTSNNSNVDKITDHIIGIKDNLNHDFTISSSSSDSAILSAFMSETSISEEEFEFPPLPLYLPPATPVNDGEEKPPPFELTDTPKEWDTESGFINEFDEDFPPPPPPECFSPQICLTEKTKNDSNINLQSTVLTSDTSSMEGIADVIDNKPTESRMSSYINLISSCRKNPFVKNDSGPSNHEGAKTEKIFTEKINETNSTRSNQNSFAKLFKQIKQESDKEVCTKSTETLEGTRHSQEHPLHDTSTVESEIQEETGFVHITPPMFDDKEHGIPLKDKSLSLDAKEQLIKDVTVNNIIKEYFKDDIESNQLQSEAKQIKVKLDPPVPANALLPNHLKGEGIKISNPNFRNKSFDSTIEELISIISNCDPKSNLTSQKSIGQADSKLSDSPILDKHDSSFQKEMIQETKKTNDRESVSNDKISFIKKEGSLRKEKLPTAPKSFKLVKTPKVVGFTEGQIQSTTRESKNPITSDPSSKTSIDKSESKETDHVDNNGEPSIEHKTVPSGSQRSELPDVELSDFSSCVNNSEIEITDKYHMSILTNSEKTETINSIENANGLKDGQTGCSKPEKGVSNLTKSVTKCNGIQSKAFGFVKVPNVVGFTEEQIKSMTKGKQSEKEEYLAIEKNNPSSDVTLSSYSTFPNENIEVMNTKEKLREASKVMNTEEKLREASKLYENKNEEHQISNCISVKRSKSASSLLKRPLISVNKTGETGLTSEELSKNTRVDMTKQIMEENNEQGCEMLAVSKAKTFFENISLTQNKNKPGSFLKKASTFSVNKMAASSTLQGLHQKYQNFKNLNVEKPEINQLTEMNSFKELATTNDTNKIIDDSPHQSVENLVNKFGILKKSPSRKGALPENCMPPECSAKLPGKSLPSCDVEPNNG